jgi:hypothetical protein
MFSRRLATFVLGIWMGCCALVDILALEGHQIATQLLDSPSPDVKAILSKSGDSGVGTLLHHAASEQTRQTFDTWEQTQLVLACTMIVMLMFTDQRKILAIAMCAMMALVVGIQHFGITPELNMLGRNTDFLADAASFNLRSQAWTLAQLYGVLETLKLMIGGVLASYFFGMESTIKRSKSRRARTGGEMLGASIK